MLSVAPNCMTRSTLEEMLEALQRRDDGDKPRDIPPALPRRAVTRSRLPSAKRRLPVSSEADGVRRSSEFGVRRRSSEFGVRRRSSEFGVRKGKMRGKYIRDGRDREMGSAEWFDVAAALDEHRTEESAHHEIGALNDFKQQVLQSICEVQKGLHGHHDRQHLNEFDEVAVTFQSYVRGEIARKEYSYLLKMKNQDTHEKQQQFTAAVQLQSVIRGWLAQRQFSHLQRLIQSTYGEVKSGISVSDVKNLSPEMLPLFVEVLRKRALRAEAALELKEKDIASLKEQVQHNEARLKESEAKMKSAKEMWQKQITPSQVNLAAGDSCKEKNEGLNHGRNGVKESEKRKVVTFKEEDLPMVDLKSGGGRTYLVIPIEKLQRMKRVIKGWMKDNKVRSRDSNTKIHSMGGEADNSHWRIWWGKKSKRS